jgi:lysophospholipase L1-like esterase
VPYDRRAAAVVCLGDSLTDGRGSTTDGNDRWPDVLADRLHASGREHIGVVNQAAGGNRLLRDGLGIAALHRLDRDVLTVAGVRWLILFTGVNDIGLADATPDAQWRIEQELLAGYTQVIERARARGIRVYGSTLTPFGGHEYDDPAGLREQTRRRVNTAIRDRTGFDAVLDFDRSVRAAGRHRQVRRSLHDGDGLHLNPAGYRALAEAVPTDLFTERGAGTNL